MAAGGIAVIGGELIIDSFAGGGGASTGIEMALGVSPDIAINHDREAIAMHAANHPNTEHHCEDVWKVDPVTVCRSRPVGLMWLSPDCKHFSKAKGGKPLSKKVRGLAWLAVHWAKAVKPRVICLENVEEFADWGPLLKDGRPCQMRKGFTFRRFVSRLSNLGYTVDWRELKACEYGAPTIRKRLFLVARRDGLPIVWPEPTHGRGLLPFRTAAECIDFSIPCPSIFERERPLAEATLRRIARGIMRYVVNNPRPFIVGIDNQSNGGRDVWPGSEPLRTTTSENRFALATPVLAGCGGRAGQSPEKPANVPMNTITSKADTVLVTPHITKFRTGSTGHQVDEPLHTICAGGEMKRDAGAAHAMGLVSASIINTRNGEREGQAPRARDIEQPYPTVTAKGSQGALVAAFLARHYGGHENDGAPLGKAIPTITAKDHHHLVTSNLVKLRNNCDGQQNDDPLHTITSGGHFGEVRAFLLKYYGTDQDPQLRAPLHTITSKDRFGLVTVEGTDYAIVDIGMRMLTPRELFRAQGFPPEYVIEPVVNGKPLTKTAQVRMVGNSVVPQLAAAIVRANYLDSGVREPRQVYA
jgi:DNA (cytosine-5)-methyltransferase 1